MRNNQQTCIRIPQLRVRVTGSPAPLCSLFFHWVPLWACHSPGCRGHDSPSQHTRSSRTPARKPGALAVASVFTGNESDQPELLILQITGASWETSVQEARGEATERDTLSWDSTHRAADVQMLADPRASVTRHDIGIAQSHYSRVPNASDSWTRKCDSAGTVMGQQRLRLRYVFCMKMSTVRRAHSAKLPHHHWFDTCWLPPWGMSKMPC